MAGLKLHVTTGEIALAANTAKTFQTIKAATGHRALIKGFGVFIKGTSSTDPPVLCELIQYTGDFGGTPASNSPIKKNPGDPETIQTTGKKWATGATEPSSPTVIKSLEIHPQTGYEFQCPWGEEYIVSNGGIMGIRLTPGNITYNATVEIDLEE